jgi:vitamin B12 transporter
LILRPSERLTVNANYSYIRSENRSGPNLGRDLPRRPRNLANVSVDWAAGRFALGSTISLVGDSFDNASNSVGIDGHFLVGLRGSVNITDAFSLYARVENLADAEYETVANFNTYGRNAHIGVRAKF